MITNLPQDLLEEILSRVPFKSTRAMRSTCRKWHTLSKVGDFTTKKRIAEAAKEGGILAIVLINRSLQLANVNINDSDPSIRPAGKLVSLIDSYKLDVTQVYHCEGLLLCTTEDWTSLVLWNPCSGRSRWISVEPKLARHRKHWYGHALGYEEGEWRRSRKILRFANLEREESVYEIYDVNSDSWRVLDVTDDWGLELDSYGLTVKGNTYWCAQAEEEGGKNGSIPCFLLCFDFTTERFAPRLPLPVEAYVEDPVVLSSVREEQLAVLFQKHYTYEMEVWVTTKIGPSAASWSKLLAVEMAPLTYFRYCAGGSFLVDAEKRAVVLFDKDIHRSGTNRDTAYFIGEKKGHFRELDLGDDKPEDTVIFPQVFSYAWF